MTLLLLVVCFTWINSCDTMMAVRDFAAVTMLLLLLLMLLMLVSQ
jgi:hypothetical protein